MIDLAAVAARINALPGWIAGPIRNWLGGAWLPASLERIGSVSVWDDGDVSLSEGWGESIMPLLPVLQIVAEARGE